MLWYHGNFAEIDSPFTRTTTEALAGMFLPSTLDFLLQETTKRLAAKTKKSVWKILNFIVLFVGLKILISNVRNCNLFSS